MDKLATYVLLPGTKEEIQIREDSGLAVLAALQAGSIEGADDEATVAELMSTAHRHAQELDGLRLELGRPAREAQKEINQYFQGAILAWTKAKAYAGKLLAAEAFRKDAKNRQDLEAAAKAAAEGSPNPFAISDVVTSSKPPIGTAYRQTTVVKITDEGLVPIQFWRREFDMAKIRAAWERGEEVPGTEVSVVTRVQVNGKVG